jgi:hypothetical protein
MVQPLAGFSISQVNEIAVGSILFFADLDSCFGRSKLILQPDQIFINKCLAFQHVAGLPTGNFVQHIAYPVVANDLPIARMDGREAGLCRCGRKASEQYFGICLQVWLEPDPARAGKPAGELLESGCFVLAGVTGDPSFSDEL